MDRTSFSEPARLSTSSQPLFLTKTAGQRYPITAVPNAEIGNGSAKFLKRIEKQAFQRYCLVLNLFTRIFLCYYK